MASSSSSSSSRTWRYNVFFSFHGPDARGRFLSHICKQFKENGITMFYDEEIERGQIITPALEQAIRGSRIAILILSEKYASSSWCLDELLEIMECRKGGQIVITIFYGVEPSDVRYQRGEFGIAFNETCGKTEEKRTRWTQALSDAAIIAGYDFKNCDNEAETIEKIAKEVSEKLHATTSRDFDGMVGLDAHLRKIESLLHLSRNLDDTPSMVVGIYGPFGIGKSTIARALHSLHSNKFHLTCFVDNLKESYPGIRDEYVLKRHLQAELLSKILNLKGITIGHLGVLQERLHNQRVLIILDDVTNIAQLAALANEPTWFGPGSRIVITTENKELLQQHGINYTYHVGFPSNDQALMILCNYAFRQSYPHNGFKELAIKVTELCGNLPLRLRVVGSSLYMKNVDEWNRQLPGLDNVFDQKHDCWYYGYVQEKEAQTFEVQEKQVQSTIVGQETMLDKTWKHLKEDEVGLMGLYGMGGVGKTTLLKQINNKFSKERCGFDFVLWVVVSKELRIENIQNDIANIIGRAGGDWMQKEKSRKADVIFNFLKEKKFVLFLDDVWEKVDLVEIGIPFPTKQNGCKVVFTTRFQAVCTHMDVEDSIEVKCLAENETFDLFQKKVGKVTLGSDPGIPYLARIVARKFSHDLDFV